MSLGTRKSILPLRDGWDRFLLHGIATPALIGVSAATAFLTGGLSWLIVSGVTAAGLTLFKYSSAMKTLRKNSAGALPLSHPVSRIVADLSLKAGLKKIPQVRDLSLRRYFPTAGATGNTDESYIFISDNIQIKLTPREMEAVLAHEIAHIAKNDMKVRAIQKICAAVPEISFYALIGKGILSLIGLAAFPGLGALAVTIGGMTSAALIRLAASRIQERRADHGAITLTKNPWALSSALNHLIEYLDPARIYKKTKETFFSGLAKKFLSTHSAHRDRTRRLRAMARTLLKDDPSLA